MKSVKTLKDTKRVYFICEYVKGIDFFEAIRKMSVVSEDDSRFYIACLIEILKYLHEKNIVHRDLKPENIMVEEDGYLKLTNFSNAKIVNSRTYSLVGSPHYIAPEVILRKGYGISADYWSLGIILYELLYEQVPFGFEENDPLNVYASVLKDKVFYQKNDNFSKEVKDFIGVLLRKDPNLRLARGFQDLRGHCWFRTVDWEKILFKEEIPPFLPLAFNFSVERVIQNFSYKQWDALIKKEENEDLALPLTSLSTRWDFDF
jgi:cGMP-dependent protein kinase